MTDEEKKAIEILKKLQKTKPYIIWGDGETPYNKSNMVSTILELIEKQSKEIEELKEDNKHQWEERCKLTFELENSTSNDKIKAKIEELEKLDFGTDLVSQFTANLTTITILQSLLEKE